MRPLYGLAVISCRATVGRTRYRAKRRTSMRFVAESGGHGPAADDLAAWEDEGGAASAPLPPKCLQVGLPTEAMVCGVVEETDGGS
jgi:hypothetical protein